MSESNPDRDPTAEAEGGTAREGEPSTWFIHRFRCPTCDAATRADRAVDCFRCGDEMDHEERIGVVTDD